MQNPMLNLLQGSQSQNNIMMQAIGAMMRGIYAEHRKE